MTIASGQLAQSADVLKHATASGHLRLVAQSELTIASGAITASANHYNVDTEGDAATDALLKTLIADHEPAYAAQWRALGGEFAHRMMAGIAAFELQVLDVQCKIKLNQHRKEAHAAMHARYAAGTPDERALAEWMRRLGMAGEELQ